MHPFRLAWIVASVAALLLPAAANATCGAEGCPFVRRGLSAEAGWFSFDLRYQDVTQDRLWVGSGEASLADVIADAEPHGEVELYTRTRSWVGEAHADLGSRFAVSATLPYINREHRHWIRHTPTYNPLFVDDWKYEGLGDATVLGQFAPLRRARVNAAVQAGVKLPTGRRHVPGEDRINFGFESSLEPSARPGTGSTDWLIGALGSVTLPWRRAMPVTVSGLARFNGRGTDDYRVGDEVQAGVSTGWSPIERVSLLGQLNFAAHKSDEAGAGAEAVHSAMRSLFVTPGVRVRVLQGLAAYGLYQARVWGHSDQATVVAGGHFLVGTSYSFGR